MRVSTSAAARLNVLWPEMKPGNAGVTNVRAGTASSRRRGSSRRRRPRSSRSPGSPRQARTAISPTWPASARGAGPAPCSRRDHLDEARARAAGPRVVRRALRVRRLPQPAHVADQRDRAHGVVLALDAPGGDRRVVHRAVERQVELDVPLEPVERRPVPPMLQVSARLVGRPGSRCTFQWPGRRLGLRAVGPELRQHAGEVAALHDVAARTAGR